MNEIIKEIENHQYWSETNKRFIKILVNRAYNVGMQAERESHRAKRDKATADSEQHFD